MLTTQQGVMRTDAGANSRSVVVTVETPEEINAAFDGITYDKVRRLFLKPNEICILLFLGKRMTILVNI